MNSFWKISFKYFDFFKSQEVSEARVFAQSESMKFDSPDGGMVCYDHLLRDKLQELREEFEDEAENAKRELEDAYKLKVRHLVYFIFRPKEGRIFWLKKTNNFGALNSVVSLNLSLSKVYHFVSLFFMTLAYEFAEPSFSSICFWAHNCFIHLKNVTQDCFSFVWREGKPNEGLPSVSKCAFKTFHFWTFSFHFNSLTRCVIKVNVIESTFPRWWKSKEASRERLMHWGQRTTSGHQR